MLWLRQWSKAIRRAFSGVGRRSRRPAPCYVRPNLEGLSDRIVPAQFVWNWTNGAADWSRAANWLADGIAATNAPGSNDDVVFNGTNVQNSTQNIAALTVKSLTVTSAFTGTIDFVATVVTVTGDMTIGGGILEGGVAEIEVEGAQRDFTWTGGRLGVNVKVGANAELKIEGNSDKTLTNTLANHATATWTGDGDILFGSLGVFSNRSGGTFDIQTTASMGPEMEVAGSFENLAGATFKKTTTGTTTLNILEFENAGTVDFQAGTVAFTRSWEQTGGETRLTGGNVSTTQTFELQGGKLTGAGTITGSVENSAGIVEAGTAGAGSITTLTITGDYIQGSGGTMVVKVSATGMYGRLNVEGTATLDGQLSVTRDTSYLPTSGELNFLLFNSRTGDFATFDWFNNLWDVSGTEYKFWEATASDRYYLSVAPTD